MTGEIQIAILNCNFEPVDEGQGQYALTYDDIIIMAKNEIDVPDDLDFNIEVSQCLEDIAQQFAKMMLEAHNLKQSKIRGN